MRRQAHRSRAGAQRPDLGGHAGARSVYSRADQTCNDDPAISSLHGTCNPDRTCACHGSFEKNPLTGRCK